MVAANPFFGCISLLQAEDELFYGLLQRMSFELWQFYATRESLWSILLVGLKSLHWVAHMRTGRFVSAVHGLVKGKMKRTLPLTSSGEESLCCEC